MRRVGRLGRECRALARRIVRGPWPYYAGASAANTTREARLALSALTGRVPLQDGPSIIEFERRFAATVGTRYAYSFGAGRMALYVLLEALGIGPGDEVVVPAFTCVVVPNAILYRGAQPVFVDIDERTFNIDVSKLEEKLTPRTKAIIAQHTFGLACDVDAVNEIASRHDVAVIEDCAHAFGAKLLARPVGSLATAAFFSTDHTKVVGTGTGGVVTTSDETLAAAIAEIQRGTPFLPVERIRRTLAVFAAQVILLRPLLAPVGRLVLEWWVRPGRENPFFLDELRTRRPSEYPYPARLGNAQARIGLSQLDLLPQNLAARRRLARLYDAELRVYDDLLEPHAANHAFVRYVFLADDRETWQRRFEDLTDMDVWFTSVAHGRADHLEEIGYASGSCPVAEHAARAVVNLPTHPRVTKPERILRRLRSAA